MRQSGFTLIELIMIMMIIGVLAVTALPRFVDETPFEARGFHDETLAALRYAQKAAIAQRRNVCVTLGTTSVSLKISPASGAACNDGGALDLAGPTGVTPFVITARSSVTFNMDPPEFQFDALGRTNIAVPTFQVVGATSSITVEQETGYVHP